MKKTQADVTIAVRQELSAARHVVIATDCWSKKGLTASFLAISAAFFSTLQNISVHVFLNLYQISHPHTGEMIAHKLEESMTEWNIEKNKILMVVTDNGANMIKAVKNVQLTRKETETAETDTDEDDNDSDLGDDASDDTEIEDAVIADKVGLPRFPCVAHTLQLVLKEIEKITSYSNLISKARALVRNVRVSSVATEKLMRKCGKTVVIDCSTRWNSAYLMINRLLEIKTPLNEVLEEMQWDTLLNNEWARLADLSNVLKPFKEQTDVMQQDNLALSHVVPCLLELSLHLQDPAIPKTLCGPLLNSLRQRFASFLDPGHTNFDSLAALACLLDPTVSATMLRDDMVLLKNAATTRLYEMVWCCVDNTLFL